MGLFVAGISLQAEEKPIEPPKKAEDIIFYIRTRFPDDTPEKVKGRKIFPIKIISEDGKFVELLIPQIQDVPNPVINHVSLAQLRVGREITDDGQHVMTVTGKDFDPEKGGKIELSYLHKYRFIGKNIFSTVSFTGRKIENEKGGLQWKTFQFVTQKDEETKKDEIIEKEFNIATLYFSDFYISILGRNGIARILFSSEKLTLPMQISEKKN